MKRLKRLGVNITNYKELHTLALQYNPKIPNNSGTSLCNLCRIYLNLNLLKTHEIADYSVENLARELIEYSALDAVISRRLGEIILSKVSNVDSNNCVAPPILEKDEKVKVLMSGRIIAEGVVSFIGRKKTKEKWGTTTLSNGKDLIHIQKLFFGNMKMQFSDESFKKNETTVGEVLAKSNNNELVFRTSSILKV